MRLIQQKNGKQVWITDAPAWEATGNSQVQVGMTTKSIKLRVKRGQKCALGQLYGIVCPGLILTRHVYKGLKRRMLVGRNRDADAAKYAYAWPAKRDAALVGDRFDPVLEYMEAPEGRTFVVYISRNEMLKDYPNIWGWIEHWAWVSADPACPSAPVD